MSEKKEQKKEVLTKEDFLNALTKATAPINQEKEKKQSKKEVKNER